MPVNAWKNLAYRIALPFFGLRTQGVIRSADALAEVEKSKLESIFRRHHVVGGCLQLIRNGALEPTITYGYKRLPNDAVNESTLFRAASITKMVTAIGAMKLAEAGRLDLNAPASYYLPYPVRNPFTPDKPILVHHLLSHTSTIWDGPGYDSALHSPIPLEGLLKNPGNYLPAAPGSAFRYSNLAAGIVGTIMEYVTGKSLERLMYELMFQPLEMNATYTLQNVQDIKNVSCIYRVLSRRCNAPLFDPVKKLESADAFDSPMPEFHYLTAAGNLFTDAVSLGKLICQMATGGGMILTHESIKKMQTPAASYGKHAPHTKHCLGLVELDDPSLSANKLYGHQGFAYGATESVFYQEDTGNGFVFLNGGASEARTGHLACVSRDLIIWALGKHGYLNNPSTE